MTRLILAALLVASCGPTPVIASPTPRTSPTASPTSAVVVAGTGVFDGPRAREHIAYLADPARGGRYSGSAGYLDAARYVADQFEAIGLEPLGDSGTYFQRFPMPIVDLSATPVLTRTGADAKSWKHRVDFTESVGGRAGDGAAEAQVVVVGGGAKSGGQDDFAGVTTRGRIALVTGPTAGSVVETAFAEGAVGVLVIGDTSIRYSFIPRFSAPTIPVLVITESVANELLAPAARTVAQVQSAVRARRSNPSAPSPAFETNVTVRMSLPLTPVRDVEGINVVGLLRGTDPDMSKRAVLVGGHLDGVGTDPDGTVFPAANDNASGPAVTIEVARALVAKRAELKRSIVFVAFAGEEQGLLGSEAYAGRMAVSPGRVESLVAYLNLDVIGCCGNTLEASDESAALVDRIRAAARTSGASFQSIRGGGSDQTTFAKRGVPSSLILWSDYILHTPRDTIALIETPRLQKAGDVVTAVALELGRGEGP
ncbi:MAG: M28 family metallopeptidase [Chloroflexota bacterium]|nr:M28 family metallopeptidase [Chloroflexota bacterium]